LTKLLTRPDGPGAAFLRAGGATAVALGIPFSVRILVQDGGLWEKFGFTIAFVGGASVLAGAVWALRSLLLRWAYDRVTSNPFG